MTGSRKVKLTDIAAENFVLYYLIDNLTCIQDDDNQLTPSDFSSDANRAIFLIMNNLAFNGVESVSPVELAKELTVFDGKNIDVDEVIKTLQVNANNPIISRDSGMFKLHCERLKKLSLLRDLEKSGFDVKDFCGSTEFGEETDVVNNFTREEIINKYKAKLNEIEDLNLIKQQQSAKEASDGILELIERLKVKPEIGEFLDGEIYNYIVSGARYGKFYLNSAPSGAGKALPNSTLIPTPYGWRKVGDIKPGDVLFDRYGNPTNVTMIFPQGRQQIYQVKFKNGNIAKCNGDHLWTYEYDAHRSKGYRTETTKEILARGLKRNGGGYKYHVPICNPVQYPHKKLDIDPYVFGLFLGDGSFREHPTNKTLQYSSKDKELVESIATIQKWQIKRNSDNNYTWYFTNNGNNVYVSDFLINHKELYNNYSQDKFIPTEYLQGDIEQRFALLQGLMDTDGSIEVGKGRCRFTTVSPQLRDNVIELVQSLGMSANYSIDLRPEKYTTGECYNITITCRPEDKPKMFRLERKKKLAEAWLNNGKRKEYNESTAIIDITPIDEYEEMTCFLVDNDEHLFLMNDFIVTHNTRTMVGNACSLAYPYIDRNMNVIVKPKYFPVLFIATEQDHSEIQTLILSYISGISEDRLLTEMSNLSEEEIMRLKLAVQIMEKYKGNFHIEYIPDPNIAIIKTKVGKYVYKHDVRFVFYDYIFSSPGLLGEFRDLRIREDER